MLKSYHGLVAKWKNMLEMGLEEDGYRWDWTTQGIENSFEKPASVKGRVVAKETGVWAASGLVVASRDLGLNVRSAIQDGATFSEGEELLSVEGDAALVLAWERIFLNLASYVSGVASYTKRVVDQVNSAGVTRPRVVSTRKTLPIYRDLVLHAVQAGGGQLHRNALDGGVLIKENHIRLAGSVATAIQSIRSFAPHGMKIEIEVTDLNELNEAIQNNADGVLLDNFSPGQVREAIDLVRDSDREVFVEVSGGLRHENISDYVIEGVDVLSVGALTHQVKSTDFSFLVNHVER